MFAGLSRHIDLKFVSRQQFLKLVNSFVLKCIGELDTGSEARSARWNPSCGSKPKGDAWRMLREGR
jgi:hypothetical protein